MAVTTRIAAPNYKIYEPDSLDAIYAKGNLDPVMGGISYAFGNAHKLNTSMDQEQFIQQQDRYNKMAAALDAMEISEKTKQEAMKIGGELIGKGEDPSKVRGGSAVYNDTGDSLLPGALRGKINAETNALNAKAAGGGSGGDVETHQTSHTIGGVTYTDTVKGKRPTGTAVGAPNPSVAPPNGSTPMPATSPAVTKEQTIARITTIIGAPPSRENVKVNPDGTATFTGPKGSITMRPGGVEDRK